MRLAYFDCFSGISGDMTLSALVHAGADLDAISGALDALPTGEFLLEREEVETHGIVATRVHVKAPPQDVIRTYASIRSLLTGAALPDRARWTAQRIFHHLAQAEARVHHKEPDVVVFHGPGERDAMFDVVGTAVALDLLGVERVFCSPVPTGMGMVRTDHGIMPVPGPVVMELLRGVPTFSRGIPAELVTPVGAAILAAVAEGFGDMPSMRVERIGYGAGTARPDFPNLLRVALGTDESGAEGTSEATVTLLEATVGGLEPAGAGPILAALRGAGAAECWLVPGVGPDGPVAVVSALVPEGAVEEVASALGGLPGAGRVRRTAAGAR